MHQESTTGTAPALPHHLSIRFTGSGSEYFRIWIVNLLLTVVTLTLYLPWAKVRKLKYFHGNTLVGDAPLGFHGNPRRMLRGYLLVSVLFVAYSMAGQFSPMAGLVALATVMVVAPALFRAALQFRLANTSWRGLRLRFTGGLTGSYVLLVPILAYALAFAGLILFVQYGPGSKSFGWHLLPWLLPLVLLLLWAMVWTVWRICKYRADHYALATLQTRFLGRQSQFIGLFIRMLFGFLLATLLVVALAIFVTVAIVAEKDARNPLLLAWLPALLIALVFVAVKPYFITRLQNLVWNHTGSEDLQFHSALRVRPMLALTLKNWLLIACTLGLYWPFAAIAMARLRLEAVSLSLREAPDLLADQLRLEQGEAAGDAAGDLFGLDVGL